MNDLETRLAEALSARADLVQPGRGYKEIG